MIALRHLALSLMLVFAWLPTANAQPPVGPPPEETPDARAQALELFRESKERYRLGDLSGAADLLERAYAIYPEPVLLYNLARAYEGLGVPGKAADTYEAYLKAQPDASDRGAIERRIVTLRSQEAQRSAPPAPPPAPPPVAPSPAPESPPVSAAPNPVPWILLGIGVAGVGVGIGLGVVAADRNDDAAAHDNALDAERLHGEAVDFAIGANVTIVAGALLAGAALVWGIVDVTSEGDRSTARFAGFRF